LRWISAIPATATSLKRSIEPSSSRSYKTGFAAVDTLDVLARVVNLPITTWHYVDSVEGLHMGPIAEDFKASFGLAGDGKSIATVDADGVALAAIQGLNQKLEAENTGLRKRLAALEAHLGLSSE
jgi:trimeric autotransporter adhesin